MAYRKNRSLRVGVAGLAVAATATLTMPAVAAAEPTVTTPGTTTPSTPETGTPETGAPDTATPETGTPGAPAPEATTPAPEASTTLPEIPGDAELADLLRTLKSSGGTEKAVEALTAILSSDGQLDPSNYLGSTGLLDSIGLDQSVLDKLGLLSSDEPGTTTPAVPTAPGSPAAPAAPSPAAAPVATSADDVLGALKKAAGATLLSPAVSPLCTDPTADNPLGLSTAPAVAVPGPWPAVTTRKPDALGALSKLLPDDKDLLTAIGEDETAFALVPPNDPGADNFRVAWFNTSTLKGGMADLKPLSKAAEAGPLKTLLTDTELFHGVRLAQVKTGQGTILTAVFGTMTKAGRTCFFLPALGAVQH